MKTSLQRFAFTCSRLICVSLACAWVADAVLSRGHAAGPKGVASWEFGTEETSRIRVKGAVQRDVAGPRAPMFPDFSESNTAIKFSGDGSHLAVLDTGPSSDFDFTNGDSISIEAWVLLDGIGDGENQYVIGKGRTHGPGLDRDNQNWGLRVCGVQGKAAISFLFATPKSKLSIKGSNGSAHWHRWTTKDGFIPETGWHHLAISYRFGTSESIRGWIDGVAVKGGWDMGGPTDEAPVTDDDAIWIGASMGGNKSTSFRGSIDSITLHRELLNDELMKSRYRREGPIQTIASLGETAPTLGILPPGQVHLTAHESMPTHTRWLNESETVPKPTLTWSGDRFLIPRLPFRYDDWGVRDGWRTPVLLRMSADVQLPAGQHRILLRARGLSRLWLGQNVIARTTTHGGGTDGHQPVKPIAAPPLPGLQPVGYEMQEVIEKLDIPSDGVYRIVLESMLGGKKFRAVPGEMCVAIETSDGLSFTLLQPAGSAAEPVHLIDEPMALAVKQSEQALQQVDEQTRRSLAAGQSDYWTKRHEIARKFAIEHPLPKPPALLSNPIDSFIAAKIELASKHAEVTPSAAASHFKNQVMPILSENCMRCHGKKESGGLRLDQRARAIQGGDSGQPAIVPSDSHASGIMARIRSSHAEERMPPGERALSDDQIAILDAWIRDGAQWPLQNAAPELLTQADLIGDEAFLRRITLDILGLPPSDSEIRSFVADDDADKRTKAIDRLLNDPRWADPWVSYWQEALAENPNMLKPSLNNSGPFRWFLYEAFLDGKSMDRIVTELILLKGSEREGGAAGFGLAADNDAPFAAKAHIVGTAFLGVEMQCARCHDSPYHSTTQKDLYSLAAMLERKNVQVPGTSTVPPGFFAKKDRESLIQVTLKPSEIIEPRFPFSEFLEEAESFKVDELMQAPADSRERLAAIITAPMNKRFAQVIVNRVFRRYIGAGIIEPPHDWEGQVASHPEMLEWLSMELVSNGYDLKHIARLIFTSQLYQREAIGKNLEADPESRFFASPDRRRLTAEQVVDSMFAAAGKPIDVEEFTFDPEGRRSPDVMISLGRPSRAWMFASVSNERDRPSLSLPKAQAVNDVLEAFGWSGSRQNPRTDRETSPNVLQSGVLANSTVSAWVTRASFRSPLAELALQADSPEWLVDRIFMRFVGRAATKSEQQLFAPSLSQGFSSRRIPESQVQYPLPLPRLAPVTWSNHLVEEANEIQLQVEQRARAGEPVDPRLNPNWREVYEDFVWSVMNTREFAWVP